ncbi:MAG: hypothetical protein WBQ06_01620 [Acidobacteriaceae bacterium]
MKLFRFIQTRRLPLAILHTAAWLVPVVQRREWLAEWKAELWHVCDSRVRKQQGCPDDMQQATMFCLGAFKDAFWLRRENPISTHSEVLQVGSPARCIALLSALAAVAVFLAALLPGVRKVVLPYPYPNPQTLVLISPSGHTAEPFPSIALANFQSWRSNTHDLFNGMAFYRPIVARLLLGGHQGSKMSLALASDNLFQVLGVPADFYIPTSKNPANAARLVLSRSAWKKYFHGNPNISGTILEVAGQKAIVVGVIDDSLWRLPGRVDGYLLEDAHAMAELPSDSNGYVVADVKPSDFPPPANGQWQMSVPDPDVGAGNYDCVSLTERSKQPIFCFLFALALACLTLPAITSLPLGDYSENFTHSHEGNEIRRWTFLASKLALILVIVGFASLDLAHVSASINSLTAEYIQLASSLCGFLFAFRWALHDQRRRCPKCLRSLTHPAYVGQSSRNFLGWNGTELMCVGGHGLLHIPDMPTSWFSTQRWLYLDPSWSSLFSDAYVGTL